MKPLRMLLLMAALVIGTTSRAQQPGINLEKIVKKAIRKNNAADRADSLVTFKNDGTVWAPKKYSNKRTGTADSERGELTSPSLKIIYDIGVMAGTHMASARKNECISYFDTIVNSLAITVGLKKDTAGWELIITTYGSDKKNVFASPANFWADVKDEKDIQEVVNIAISYKPKS